MTFARVVFLFSIPWLWSGSADAAVPYMARQAVVFEHHGQPPLDMPSAVAVSPKGDVLAVDGVNDRLVRFDSQGRFVDEIRSVGGETLSRPISAHYDKSGRLWIANTGRQRVLVRGADGELVRVIPIERGSQAQVPDVTDVFPRPDGQQAWWVDNDNNRLVLFDVQTGTQTVVGESGEALGQFRHPFMLALGGGGDLFVSDVVNGRVQFLSASGRPAGAISSYGADLGQVYRPGGVACDREGNIWVADSVLGVVQVFTALGELRDVVRGEDEKPLKLNMPLGIALDADGNLYVAEVAADRVRKFSITVDPRAALPVRERTPEKLTGQQARECTLCHIEWLQSFAQGQGTVLLEPPAQSVEQPPASRSEMCLSCHDGAVADSRRRIWLEHGHGTNILPPAGMQVPANLPLVNGRIACRTCHSAHASGAPIGDIRTAVFLRVPNTAGQLCVGCHRDKTRGPELGTHPTGGMPWPVPKPILEAGGRVGPNPRELICQVCHTPHGAAHEHLLVMGTETNQLCLTCHDQMRPGMFRDGAAEHPLSPKVSPEQARAIQEMGTKLSPDEKLICLSCHKLHHGKGKRFMLADELQDAQLCLRCHAERKAMLGSAHDLRKDFPEEKNRLGMTPETGGPCSACHLFHRYARAPEFSEVDPGGGKCISCHQKGRVAEAKVLPPLNHPKAPCTGCHNPHHPSDGRFLAGKPVDVCSSCHADEALLVDGKHDIMHSDSEAVWPTESEKTKDTCLACHRPHGNQETGLFRAGLAEGLDGKESACAPCHTAKVEKEFNHPGSECKACHNPHLRRGAFILADKPSDLCSDCHAEKAVLAGGRHDISRSKVAWPAESVQSNDLCLACHRPHGDEKTGLFRAGLAEGVSGRDAGCVACHIGTEPKIGSQIALMHTSDGEKLKIESKLPMGCSPEGDRLILCRTCHNPHGGPDAAKTLLRIKPGEKEQQVCLDCHVDAAHIEAIGHGTEPLRAAGFETGACKPCHLVHAKAHSVEAKYLWPKQLAYPQDATPPVRVPDQPCRACHRTGGPVAPPAIATHPKADFFNPTPPASAGFLPLFNDRGEIDPQGSHACRTCHLTHGRTAPAPMPEGLGKASEREVRARQWHIRAFGSGNVCATCHGFDALRRFMYFHDAARRGGPIEKPPPVGG